MQKWSQQICNPKGDNITLAQSMGLVALDEDTMGKNMALGVELASKCGILMKNWKGNG
jgi:hypothetical protein